MKQLIVNADDFGLHELINEGIVEGHVAGCVTSTSIMAGGDAFEHAVRLASKYPKLGVGVHLTLVGTRPVARGDIHTLLNKNGVFFPSYGQFIKKYISGQVSKKHIEWELLCQLRKVAGTGIKITHVDSHQHLHVLPGLTEIIGRVAREFNINKIRIPAEPIGFLGMGIPDMSRFFAKAVLTGCSLLAQNIYTKMGFFFPQHFFGMLAGGSMQQSSLLHILEELPDGISEIMVHPGKNNQSLEQLFQWEYHWQEEMEALKCKEVFESIKKREIQLIHYGNIGGRLTTLFRQ